MKFLKPAVLNLFQRNRLKVLSLSTEPLPVNEIVVAPKNHIDLAKKGMDYMMKALNYDVPVTLSDIKLRY